MEDVDSDKPPTKKSDVWSFGCLCLEVFTGNTPFYRCKRDIHVMKALQMGEKPNQPREGDDVCSILDGWIRDMMADCWETDPQKRPTFIQIRHALVHNVNEPDERPKAPVRDIDRLAFWEDMRAQSGVEVDDQRVEQLIRDFYSRQTWSWSCFPDAIHSDQSCMIFRLLPVFPHLCRARLWHRYHVRMMLARA